MERRRRNREDDLGPERIRAQLERILNSEGFREAHSLQGFLRYVVEKTLEGKDAEIKERSVGVDVFHRAAEYDPGSDAVVRVQASILRKRLNEFYEHAGAGDDVRIEIPKGGYVPRFAWRRGERAPRGGAGAQRGLPIRALKLGLAFGAGLAAAALLFWLTSPPGAPAAGGEPGARKMPPAPFLWGAFFEPGSTTTLAYGTAQFFGAGEGVQVRDVTVNSPDQAGKSPFLQMFERKLQRELVPHEIYTGIGEANGLLAISNFFHRHGVQLRVLRSRLIHWRDLKSDNLIFLTSFRFRSLAKELEFPAKYVFSSEEHPRAEVVDLEPRPGLPQTYLMTIKGNNGDDYAIVSLLPGKAPGRRILLLSGMHTWGTQGAAEYVVDRARLKELERRLSSSGQAPGFFQVLLKVEVRDSQPVAVSYVSHHALEIGE